jgi:hypothetical protein
MKIRPVGSEVYHTDGRTYRRDEAKQSTFHSFTNAPKNSTQLIITLIIIRILEQQLKFRSPFQKSKQ